MCYPVRGQKPTRTRAGTREGGCLSQKKGEISAFQTQEQIEETVLGLTPSGRIARTDVAIWNPRRGHHAVPGAGPQPKSSPALP